jgi:hypothetical protein
MSDPDVSLSDQGIVKAAYQDAVEKYFAVFLDAVVAAKNDQKQVDVAKQRFKAAVAVARTARDTAISVL